MTTESSNMLPLTNQTLNLIPILTLILTLTILSSSMQ